MSLLHLSQELIVHILAYLHYNDLNAVRRVNHALNKLIQSSILLQYSMQLQLSGYEDNPYSPMVIIDKLRLLRQQDYAWSCLDFDKQSSIPIPFNPSSLYDLTDGVILLGESSSGRQSGADAIRWSRLSSLVFGLPQARSWESIDVGHHIIDVGLSVLEHDLIVIATDRETDDRLGTIFDLRLIQLSTGLSHPLASKPIVPLVTIPSLPQTIATHCSICIEIIGDLLCCMFHYPIASTTLPAMFEVYNWKSGTHLQTREIDCASYATFTFLSPNIVALPNCKDNTIELCRLDDKPNEDHTPLTLQTSCVLQLPRLGKNHSIAQMTCRSEPKMTRFTGSSPAFRSREPFHLNPQDAIAIFNVMTHDVSDFHECFTLIVHSASLLSVLANPPPAEAPSPSASPDQAAGAPSSSTWPLAPSSTRGDPPLIPWSHWGPRACRWLETSFGVSRWITTTCGQRYATVEEDPVEDELTRTTIVVYDFNPHTVRRLATLHRRRRRRPRAHTAWEFPAEGADVHHLHHHHHHHHAFQPFHPPADNDNELGHGHGGRAPRLEETVLIPFTDPQTRVIGQIQCEPTELRAAYGPGPEDGIFQERVRTSLPYAQSSSFETYGYGAVLMDGNMIIGVKLNDADDIRELVVHSIRTRRDG